MRNKNRGDIGMGAIFAILALAVVFAFLISTYKKNNEFSKKSTSDLQTEIKKIREAP